MGEHNNDWGEVIMGNSPFAEYLKELEKSSDLDVAPILAEQILPPPEPTPPINEPPPPPQPSAEPINNVPTNNNTTMSTVLLQTILSKMYHKVYNSVVGSELLHPEESIFMCEDDGPDQLKLQPDLIAGEDFKGYYDLVHRLSRTIQPSKAVIWFLMVPIVLMIISSSSPIFSLVSSLFILALCAFGSLLGTNRFLSTIQARQEHIYSKIDEVVEFSKQYDNHLLKAMKAILEVELISRGYRLSSPLSPIERLEQSAKSRKSVHMRVKAANSLIQSQSSLRATSVKLLSYLPPEISRSYREKIYSVEIANMGEEPALADLKAAYYQYYLSRSRFFSIMLLAFSLVTQTRQNTLWHCCKELLGWQYDADEALSTLSINLQNYVLEIKNCVRAEFWANQIPQRVLLNTNQRTVHERFFHQSKELKLFLQGIIARIALCEENVNITNSDNDNADIDTSKNALSELVEHYQIVRRDLAKSLELWDSGNILLLKIIDSLSKGEEDPQLKELRNLVKDGPTIIEPDEEPPMSLALELAQAVPEDLVEQIFEAYTGPKLEDSDSEDEPEPPKPPPTVSFVPGVPPPPPPMGLKFVSKKKPKKSRAERLAEKEKNAMVRAMLPEQEKKQLMTELKDVLKVRNPSKT